MGIGGVKAVEIGAGCECASLRGSEMNDPLFLQEGKIDFESNHASGILGGISTGAPIVCKIAVKPTPSIVRPQRTVDLARGEATEIRIKGRHDPAIPPRIVPVAEAMASGSSDLKWCSHAPCGEVDHRQALQKAAREPSARLEMQ
jgi:chorismate synthase